MWSSTSLGINAVCGRLQTPRRTQGPGQLTVGLGVVEEQLLGRVPAQLALQMEGAPGELADGVRAHGDVDVGDGLLPRADTFQEVPLVERADRQVDGDGGERFLRSEERRVGEEWRS